MLKELFGCCSFIKIKDLICQHHIAREIYHTSRLLCNQLIKICQKPKIAQPQISIEEEKNWPLNKLHGIYLNFSQV